MLLTEGSYRKLERMCDLSCLCTTDFELRCVGTAFASCPLRRQVLRIEEFVEINDLVTCILYAPGRIKWRGHID